MSTRALGLLILLVLLSPSAGLSQQGQALVAGCVTGTPQLPHACVDATLAARSLITDTGFLLSLGSAAPGSWGPLRRNTPRFDVSFRIAGLRAHIPVVTHEPAVGQAKGEFVLKTIQGNLVAGLFEGFQVKPTVGGLLSLDLLAQGHFLFFPKEVGLDSRMGAFSLGVRLGLVRETFTLPGIAVSVSRRFMSPMTLDWESVHYSTGLVINPSISSLRLTIGKSISSLGLMAGAGLDSHNSEVTLMVLPQDSDPTEFNAPLVIRRPVLFSGVSLSLLILQLSTEIGWAFGPSMLEGRALGPIDLKQGSGFLSLAARLSVR